MTAPRDTPVPVTVVRRPDDVVMVPLLRLPMREDVPRPSWAGRIITAILTTQPRRSW